MPGGNESLNGEESASDQPWQDGVWGFGPQDLVISHLSQRVGLHFPGPN